MLTTPPAELKDIRTIIIRPLDSDAYITLESYPERGGIDILVNSKTDEATLFGFSIPDMDVAENDKGVTIRRINDDSHTFTFAPGKVIWKDSHTYRHPGANGEYVVRDIGFSSTLTPGNDSDFNYINNRFKAFEMFRQWIYLNDKRTDDR